LDILTGTIDTEHVSHVLQARASSMSRIRKGMMLWKNHLIILQTFINSIQFLLMSSIEWTPNFLKKFTLSLFPSLHQTKQICLDSVHTLELKWITSLLDSEPFCMKETPIHSHRMMLWISLSFIFLSRSLLPSRMTNIWWKIPLMIWLIIMLRVLIWCFGLKGSVFVYKPIFSHEDDALSAAHVHANSKIKKKKGSASS